MDVYELKCFHHRKAWRNGDLEAEDILDSAKVYKTRKEANNVLLDYERYHKRRGYRVIKKLIGRGDKPSEMMVYTGNTWMHENSGETEEETYYYIVKKV